MSIIYQPKGRAQEYAESTRGAGDGWAINLYEGCEHACEYCYVPEQPPWKFKGNAREIYHREVRARKGILPALAREAAKMKGFPYPVHLCFTCDPWPISAAIAFSSVTREALEILARNEFQNVQVLTKGGLQAAPELDIIQANGWKFGQTIVTTDHDVEPGASEYSERVEMLQRAHRMGIFTWVSLEPVVDIMEAFKIMGSLKHLVDLWKVGKLNYGQKISPRHATFEQFTDWAAFVRVTKAILEGSDYLLKASLQALDQPACQGCMRVEAGLQLMCLEHDYVKKVV